MASQSTSHPAAVAVTPSTSSLEGDRGGSGGCASSTGSCHATQPRSSKAGDASVVPPQPKPGVAERQQPYINTTYRRASSLDLLVHTLESAVERAIAPPPPMHHPPIPRDAASSMAPPPAPTAPQPPQKNAAAASAQAGPPLPPPPRRPMTAYTLFFLLEREHVIQTLDGPDASPTLHEGKVRLPDVPRRYRDILLPPDWCAGPGKRKKRRHRKAHGKIGFHELSKVVAGRWARLDEVDGETKEYVKKIAKRQLDVYHAEMKEYRKRTKGLGIAPTKAGGGAKSGGKKQPSKAGGTPV